MRALVCLLLLAGIAQADDAVRIEAKEPNAAARAVLLEKQLLIITKQQKSKDNAIGAKLGVTHAITGKLEKRGARYTVTLSLINLATKQRVRSLRDTTTDKADVRKWARTLYTRTLDEGTGELVITANARRGKILVDGQPVTELYDGSATIAALALGAHQIEIRASGYKPFAVEVTIDGNTKETFLLDPM